MKDFTLIVDVHEKKPWIFTPDEVMINIKHEKLKTGDYSIEGFEDEVCVERKNGVAELAMWLGRNKRICNEQLTRMKHMKYKMLIVECPWNYLLTWPQSSKLPPDKMATIQISSHFLMARIYDIMDLYGIPVFFADNRIYAQHTAEYFLKRTALKL